MKLSICASLKGQSHLMNGINYDIFTKSFEIELTEEELLDRAFSNSKARRFEIVKDGLSLYVVGCEVSQKVLHTEGLLVRASCSQRIFRRLEDLGWKFYASPAHKMNLPNTIGPLSDEFLWERLSQAA